MAGQTSKIDNHSTIGFPHRAAPTGGPGSFQKRLANELLERGYQIVYPDSRINPSVILVVGGTARLDWLIRCKRNGTRIIHRLDGINWRHRVIECSSWYKLRSEVRNKLVACIRNRLANYIVYQSHFVKDWWDKSYGRKNIGTSVIYNAVDLNKFFPQKTSDDRLPLILCVESQLVNDSISMRVIKHIEETIYNNNLIRGIRIVGDLGRAEKEYLSNLPGVEIYGSVEREGMPSVYREGDIFLNLDINAACPNAVVEALATGLPVVGYRTGALPELVPPSAGKLVNYEANPWRVEQPNIGKLSNAIKEVIKNQRQLSDGARKVAEVNHKLSIMVDAYIEVLVY